MEEKFADCAKINERIVERKIGGRVAADSPKISVIIPAYQVAPFIVETLESVFRQTFQNYEIILVNDGSPDTKALESALAPHFARLVYIKQTNAGAAGARSTAICAARGELLAFLDGDDIWLPEFLRSQIDFLESNRYEMVYCDALLFGEPLFEGRTFMRNAPSDGIVNAAALLGGRCSVITSGTVLKKDLPIKYGLFDQSADGFEDFDLWFRLAKNAAKIGYQRASLLKYRVRHGSLSGSTVERAKRTLKAYEFVENKYDLTTEEREILLRRRRIAEAELHLETAKYCLTGENFAEARTHFAEANKFYRKPKLTAINWLLRIAPRLTTRLFKKIRPAEFSFVAPEKS